MGFNQAFHAETLHTIRCNNKYLHEDSDPTDPEFFKWTQDLGVAYLTRYAESLINYGWPEEMIFPVSWRATIQVVHELDFQPL